MSAKIPVAAALPSGPKSAWDQPIRHATRLCLIFLQRLFSAAPEGHYRWALDETLTEITITSQCPINASVIKTHPAIVAIRGPLGWANLTMDDVRDRNLKTGEETHTDLLSGTFTMNCLADNSEVAEDISFVVGAHFWLLSQILLRLGFHTIGKGIQIGSVSPPGGLISGDTTESMINVPVVIPYTYQHTALFGPEHQVLFSGIELEMELRMADVIRPVAAAATGGIGSALLESGSPPRFVRQRYTKGPVRDFNSQAAAENETVHAPQAADPPLTVTINVEE